MTVNKMIYKLLNMNRATKKINKNVDKFNKDDRGFSLIMVIAIMGFIAILGTIVLYMAMMNYKIKLVNVQNTVSFYSAEHALDEIKAGIEGEVSKALSEAYVTVMQKYTTSGMTADKRQDKFATTYIELLRKTYKTDSSNVKYKVSTLNNYLVDTEWDDLKGVGAQLSSDYSVVVAGLTSYEGDMVVSADSIVFKNLLIEYRSPEGSVSKIKTDIRVELPKIKLSENLIIPDIASYSMIANDKIEVINLDAPATIGGSIYAGLGGIEVDNSNFTFNTSSSIITDGNLVAQNGADLKVDSNSTLWANGIKVGSATGISKAQLDGTVYLADDLELSGAQTQVTLKGNFYAYGTGKTVSGGDQILEANKSSSIIINGTDTNLDMSGVKRLYVAGTAFINSSSAASFDTNKSNLDALTGESLTAKSNQIAYLIPAECLLVKNGKATANSNPVKWDDKNAFDNEKTAADPILNTLIETLKNSDEYKNASAEKQAQLVNDKKKQHGEYDLQEVDFSCASVNMRAALESYVDGYQTIYKTIGGVKYVYYYMTFASERKASLFFKAYFDNNKDKINKYISNYIADLKIPDLDDETAILRVDLAGNIFKQNILGDGSIEYDLVEARSTTDSLDLSNESKAYSDRFKSKCYTLFEDGYTEKQRAFKEIGKSTLTGYDPIVDAGNTQFEKAGIFYNIVNRNKYKELFIDKFAGVDANNDVTTIGNIKQIYVEDGGLATVVLYSNNTSDTYELSGRTDSAGNAIPWDKVKVIVANCNVKVEGVNNFKGIIVSGGKISMRTSGRIDNDEASVPMAMKLSIKLDSVGNNMLLAELFKEDDSSSVIDDSSKEGIEAIDTSDLIVYKNWRKE